MNNTFDNSCDTNLENNFNNALNMCANTYSYDDLIDLLNSTEIVKKQFAALNLSEIKTKEDAEILVSNLVGQDGKVREAVAFKLNELVKNDAYRSFFLCSSQFDTYLQGIMDINGNVCRQMVEVVDILKTNAQFNSYICEKLPEMLENIIDIIKNLEPEDKKYVISKRNFQLYWGLEVLDLIKNNIDLTKIKEILLFSSQIDDYTIREKVAKILSNVEILELEDVKTILKHDDNYYVKRYLNEKYA